MIISENPKPSLVGFQKLMENVDQLLNADAKKREEYYTKRSGTALEADVYEAVCESAKGTKFQNTIHLVSGASFPDIIANKYYGVEVKSTNKNHWTSIGSSILESTRNQDVERIYLTFGKLGKPVRFLSRPYEECLSGIAVTHYPRYQIDMRLKKGETIFDKMGISYDELRTMENPVVPVSHYYKSRLRPGESLWWAGDVEESSAPATIRLWSALSAAQKEECIIQGLVLFPELTKASGATKYNRYSLWLASQKGVVNPNARDGISAGGQVLMKTAAGFEVKMPAVFGRIQKYRHELEEVLLQMSESTLKDCWKEEVIFENRIEQWCALVAAEAGTKFDANLVMQVLKQIFQF